MKKLGLILVMLVMLLLYGCSAEGEPMLDTSIYGNMDFNFETMTFTDLEKSDILDQTGNSIDDFVILHRLVTQTELSEEESQAYAQLFAILELLVDPDNLSYRMLSEYSSSDFRDLCDNNSITLTPLDIITFNNYKSLFSSLRETYYSNNLFISKIEYIHQRLDRTLTSEEIRSLNILQEDYYNLINRHDSESIVDISFDDLILDFNIYLAYEPTDEVLVQMQTAYDIVHEMITN